MGRGAACDALPSASFCRLAIVVGAADTYGMTLIHQYPAHQQVQGFSPRTVDRRIWSLGLWDRHLARRGATVTTATVEHLETFLARWPSPQSRYSIRSDIHQLYRFIAAHFPDCADPTDGLDPTKAAPAGGHPDPRRRSPPPARRPSTAGRPADRHARRPRRPTGVGDRRASAARTSTWPAAG